MHSRLPAAMILAARAEHFAARLCPVGSDGPAGPSVAPESWQSVTPAGFLQLVRHGDDVGSASAEEVLDNQRACAPVVGAAQL